MEKRYKKFLKFKTLFYIVLVVVFILSIIPDTEELPEITKLSDKLTHIFAFITLAFLIDFGYPDKSFFWKLSYLVLYGLMIEMVQYFIPYREFSLFDFATDIIGLSFYFFLRGIWKRLPSFRYK